MRRKKSPVLLICILIIIAATLAYISGNINKLKNFTAPSQTSSSQTSSSQTTSSQTSSSVAPTPVSTPTPVLTPTPVNTQLKVIAVGDIMLGRKVGKLLENKGYAYAFEQVAPILKHGDVIFGNLESPITSSNISLSKDHKIILKAAPQSIDALKTAGFNVLSIANNHMMDYYEKGMLDTINILNKNKIANCGGGKNLEAARKPAIIEKNGLKYGVLAYTDMAEYTYVGNPNISYAAGRAKSGVAPRKLELILEDIAKIRPEVDILAVSLHWGVEESFDIPASQTEFAHKLIDAGADVILGHHPHQFQGIEIYKGKPVIYSMGNFLFDQNDPENQESFILDMQYSGKQLQSFSAIPVRTLEKHHVAVQTGSSAVSLLEREASLSRKLGSECKIENDRLVFSLD